MVRSGAVDDSGRLHAEIRDVYQPLAEMVEGNRRGSISSSPVPDHRVASCRGHTEAPEVAPAIIDAVCGMAWSASAPKPFAFGGFTDGREGWKSGSARPDLS